MTLQAMNALSAMLQMVPAKRPEDWKDKAEILTGFAKRVSDEVIRRSGIPDDTDTFQQNCLATIKPKDSVCSSNDLIVTLNLWGVPACLKGLRNGRKPDEPEFILMFYPEEVIDLNPKTCNERRIMSYEQTARMIVFWFAEKILLAIRKNRWDQVEQLPDIFDRIAGVIAETGEVSL